MYMFDEEESVLFMNTRGENWTKLVEKKYEKRML